MLHQQAFSIQFFQRAHQLLSEHFRPTNLIKQAIYIEYQDGLPQIVQSHAVRAAQLEWNRAAQLD